MKINVGSKNEVKVSALKELLAEYDFLAGAEVGAVDAPSEVSKQPKSLEETITGAINRARYSFNDCDLSCGIESGLMRVPSTKSGYMDVCVCAIYDRREFHLGLSSAFECPRAVIADIFSGDLDMNQAFSRAGLTNNPKLGSQEGAVGLLTKGRLTRKEYTKQAIRTALIHLENEI